ncbi:hypothetical protein G7Y89_g8483 [Cudoniella acicularis]|uniref:Uncharacterized protein n=1 Tax=Cudoniella acicularis TaxID=354080 RepID=A0A8H4RIS5_9HELO|nr:hypothetical protein G7Y89_g8483 [Cudoniella acicularis]
MMHSPNTMSVPGAFNFSQQRDHGSAPRLSGAKSHIFQPPRTHPDSASSSLIMTRSTNSIVSMSTTTSTGRSGLAPRKRARVDAGDETPRGAEEDWSTTLLNSGEAVGAEVCPGSPTPFVNTKYVLQGGMDTPTLKAAQLATVDADYSDVGYRKSLDADGMQHTRRGLFSDMEGPNYFPADGLGRDANGRGRGWNSPRNSGWSKAAIEVVGEVVGKVWEFCKHSGSVEQNGSFWETEKHSTWGPPDLGSTPLPGKFPEADFIPDYIDRAAPDADARPAKRRQVSKNSTHDEIAKNWVVVPPPSTNVTPSKPPNRGPARYSMATASSAGRRSTAVAPVRPASRAGFASTTRRPMVPRVSHAGSPALNSNRPASFASPRSSPSTMIREGKEALGTKIEVDIEDDDFDLNKSGGGMGTPSRSNKWAV